MITKLTNNSPIVNLVNHYTTRGVSRTILVILQLINRKTILFSLFIKSLENHKRMNNLIIFLISNH